MAPRFPTRGEQRRGVTTGPSLAATTYARMAGKPEPVSSELDSEPAARVITIRLPRLSRPKVRRTSFVWRHRTILTVTAVFWLGVAFGQAAATYPS